LQNNISILEKCLSVTQGNVNGLSYDLYFACVRYSTSVLCVALHPFYEDTVL